MGCDPFKFKLADGTEVTGIACSRGRQSKPCTECGGRSTKLCDFPLRGPKAGKTCDAALCGRCAVKRGADVDYCPPHARLEP